MTLVVRSNWRWTSKQNWLIWVVFCAFVTAAFLFIYSRFPIVDQDGVQIIEYGRASLHPSTEWSISWDIGNHRALLAWAYPGAVLQELAFRLSRPSGIGPHLLSLIAALVAATCAFGWLKARRVPIGAALVLAMIFLTDPMFSSAYLQGRVDGWAFACCLGACWLLRSASNTMGRSQPAIRHAAGAGALLAASAFFWPTSIMLAPLVLLELFYTMRAGSHPVGVRNVLQWSRPVLWFSVGGLLGTGIFIIPMLSDLAGYVQGFEAILAVQQRAASIQIPIFDAFFVRSPLLVISVIVALCLRREWGLIIAIAFAIASMLGTMIYPARLIYLLPYLLAIIGFAFCSSQETKSRSGPTVLAATLAVLLAINLYSSLAVRPWVAAQHATAVAQVDLTGLLEREIGGGQHRVLLEEWSAYYAARELGWHLYLAGAPVSGEEYSRFLQTMDFVVVRAVPYEPATLRLVQSLGFELQATLDFPIIQPSQLMEGSLFDSPGVLPTRKIHIFRSPETAIP